MGRAAIVIYGEDVLLLGDHVAEAPARGVFEGDARGLLAKDSVDIISVVELVIEAIRNLDGLVRVAVLDDDQMVGFEEGPPHLEEVEVADSRDHDVELVFQRWGHGGEEKSVFWE
ncbi:UvrABC system protein B [Striga asiatica]|uniref:UvrABC system protein B n=1 Tax=Striga asiatica TaxID=4170 RepID=A0A5A7QIY2_STRAF|nr:UvrABC system protein B [Striga asiatica]